MQRIELVRWLAAAVLLASLGMANDASAQRTFGANPDAAPSVLAYGLRGFGIGAVLGLSTGYLVERDDHWGGEDWQGLGIGVGLGSVIGAVAGLSTGFWDLSLDRPGVGAIVLRDTFYGTLLGALVGAAAGTVFWIAGNGPEDLLLGGSIGSLVGAGMGVFIGFIEGPRIVDEYGSQERSAVASAPRLHLGMGVQRLGDRFVPVPSLSGRF